MRLVLALAAALAAATILPAQADAERTAAVFAAASVAERQSALAALSSADAEGAPAVYATGAVAFFTALEGLAQAFHRHGFESPRSFMLPLMQLPVPRRDHPEPLAYEGFRAILAELRDDLAAAAETLSRIPDDADIAIDVDLARLGVDLDGDGEFGPQENVAAIIAALAGPRSRPDPAALSFRFDRADGYWLQAYANVLMAQAEFWLAHDFREAFDGSFHMIFPRAGLPLQDALVPAPGERPEGMAAAEWRIADFVSFLHLVDWPVVEPERRRAVRGHLMEMIRLSRENWKAIRAETDNEREWLPGPQQGGIHALTGLEVTEEQVAAWHEVLDTAEGVLEGRTLVPHFRISGKGMNMRRFFEEPEPFDLVLTVTGPGAVPYLEEGRVLTAEEWRATLGRFGRPGFLPFAIWFN